MRTFIMTIFLFFVQHVFAQKKAVAEKNVPAVIVQKFNSQYPVAKSRDWKTENNEYEVDFYVGMKKYEAKYEVDGKWKKTTAKIDKKDVPAAVMSTFRSSEYRSWTIDNAYLVEDNERKDMYQLKVVKGNNITELLYTSGGDLLKTKNKSN